MKSVHRRIALLVAAVIVGLVVAGFIHVVHGGGVGLKLCAKHEWALGDTFVDLDGRGDSLFSNKDNPEVLVALLECGALGRPDREGTAPAREISRQHAASTTEHHRVARPELTLEPAAEPGPASSIILLTPEAKRQLTEAKVRRYVHEAYPAWHRAHPDQACPHQLIELNEYLDDRDANDAWGRPLKLLCSPARLASGKGVKVLSRGRDAEQGTEDDIAAEE